MSIEDMVLWRVREFLADIRRGRRFDTWEIKEAAEQLNRTRPTIEGS